MKGTVLGLVTTPGGTKSHETDAGTLEIFDAITRRAFELFEARGRVHGHELEDWVRAESEFLQPTPIELAEDDEKIRIQAEVPGFKPKELEVKVEPSRLLIKGKSSLQERAAKSAYSEFGARQIYRVVNLPTEVAPERATAGLRDGILELSLPKAATSKRLSVEVRAAS